MHNHALLETASASSMQLRGAGILFCPVLQRGHVEYSCPICNRGDSVLEPVLYSRSTSASFLSVDVDAVLPLSLLFHFNNSLAVEREEWSATSGLTVCEIYFCDFCIVMNRDHMVQTGTLEQLTEVSQARRSRRRSRRPDGRKNTIDWRLK